MDRKVLSIALLSHCNRFLVVFFLMACGVNGTAQQVHSIGIFAGFNLPGTIDAGINNDPRYRTQYAIKAIPFGLHYGIEFRGIGFAADPSILRTGQNYYVINAVGGQMGERNINVDYLHIPASFKVHLIEMAYFRLSFVTSVSAGILLGAKERIWHYSGLMFFPPETYPKLPPEYVVDTESVAVPNLKQTELVTKSDFKQLMLFAGAGFKADWDKTEAFRVSFDLRINYGFTEPRTREYTDKVKNYDAIYDIYGRRRELFISFTVGVFKTIQISSVQSDLKYKKRKTREWRAPKYTRPKKGKDN